SEAHAGVLYLVDQDNQCLAPRLMVVDDHSEATDALPAYALADAGQSDWLRQACAGDQTVALSLGYEQAGAYQPLLHRLDSPRLRLVACGLHNSRGVLVGALVLLQRDQGLEDDEHNLLLPDRTALCRAISRVAALCIESQRLLLGQKQLLDGVVLLTGGAVEARSPHAAGRRRRGAGVALRLGRGAAGDRRAFADYRPGPDDWEAVRIAAWLHDCGKVTTPEYVVDKAA